MTILSNKTDIYKQFLGRNISNESLDSCIHAIQSNKCCPIHAIQSGGRLFVGGGAHSVFGLLGERLFERGR